MSTERTAQEWLAIPEQDLPTELAKVLTPGPWKHKRDERGKCLKCGSHVSTVAVYEPVGCNVPGPIKIDWNTAMEYMRKCDRDDFIFAMWKVTNLLPDREGRREKMFGYCVFIAQPNQYLIAAALCAERKEE